MDRDCIVSRIERLLLEAQVDDSVVYLAVHVLFSLVRIECWNSD